MSRHFHAILFLIFVASAGCSNADNIVGSLGRDARAGDGPGRDTSGTPSQSADSGSIALLNADAAAPDSASMAKDTAQKVAPADLAAPDGPSVIKDASQEAPATGPFEQPVDPCTKVSMVWRGDDGSEQRRENYSYPDDLCDGYRCLVENEISPLCHSSQECPGACGGTCVLIATMRGQCSTLDASVIDALVAMDGSADHRCQLSADGTCSAATPNTSCTPFFGHRYDDGAGCFSDEWTTLGCCTTASGEFCALPTQSGCQQVTTAGGTVAYWTPDLATAAVTIPGGQVCDANRNLLVSAAHSCGMRPDAAATVPLPRCGSDNECCVTVDWCYGQTRLDGTSSTPGTQPPPDMCLACIPPAIQVQCLGGYCVGTKVSNVYDSSNPLLRSHCGYIAPPDAGITPPVSSDAGAAKAAGSSDGAADGGVSYKTSWSCGEY